MFSDIVGPFFSVKKRDTDRRPLTEPAQKPRGVPQTQWTQEEDDVLLSFGKLYQHNWVLIAELMTAEHLPKTPWECYERCMALDTPEQRAKPRGVARVDAKDRLIKHQKIISQIMRKIRNARGDTRNPPSVANSQQPPRKISLQAHETHHQAQLDAGVDVNSRPLNPLELSQIKARHDQEVRSQQESHRTAQFGAARSAVSRVASSSRECPPIADAASLLDRSVSRRDPALCRFPSSRCKTTDQSPDQILLCQPRALRVSRFAFLQPQPSNRLLCRTGFRQE